MAQAGRDLKDHLMQCHCHGQNTFHQTRQLIQPGLERSQMNLLPLLDGRRNIKAGCPAVCPDTPEPCTGTMQAGLQAEVS